MSSPGDAFRTSLGTRSATTAMRSDPLHQSQAGRTLLRARFGAQRWLKQRRIEQENNREVRVCAAPVKTSG